MGTSIRSVQPGGGGYLLLALSGGFIGSGLSGCIRLRLATPAGVALADQVSMTSHAVLIVFFLVMPALVATFGNWLMPPALAAGDLALPRVNNLSLWGMPASVVMGLFGLLVDEGPGCG